MAIWDSLKDIIGVAAPTVAGALGGPLAGMAGAAIVKALGLENEATEAQIANAFQSPDALVKLKQAELEFQASLKKADVDLERIGMMDRASARKRESDTGDCWTNRLLACLIVLLCGYCTYALMSGDLNQVNSEVNMLISGLVGYAFANLNQVYSYYFGSSRGSAMKTTLNTGGQNARRSGS